MPLRKLLHIYLASANAKQKQNKKTATAAVLYSIAHK